MEKKSRRSLALTDEAVRHPFRQMLPREIRASALALKAAEPVLARPKRSAFGEDTQLFLLSFLAFFSAFYLFIF
ncbi:MAG: hypothetical protein U5J78_06470 [Parasphingorhabdus sp.]|nr:hypothetical protein [Parasphingorhabdus sp.]